MTTGCPRHRLFILIAMGLQTGLLAWSAWRHSPVVSEVGHLPAGVSHWRFARFDLYRVNPPLVRMVAAAPVLLAEPATDWENYSVDPHARRESNVGIDFVNANGDRTFQLYTIGRWACIPFSWLGAWICYRWARELYGVASGLTAMSLWCFSPNILGNASLMMPDAPAAALTVSVCYAFWRWLKLPTWWQTVAAGCALGVAELAKTTLIVFYPLWPLLWLLYRLPDCSRMRARSWLREAGMVATRTVLALFMVNLGYAFEGTGQRLGDYRFQSHLLTGENSDDRQFAPGNRFADNWLAGIPVLLPKNYLQGIDTQKVDFERGIRSYLRGQWSERGYWYFYLYGLAIKVPLGTWALLALAITATWRLRPAKTEFRDELAVLLPSALLLLVVSSQAGFSIHFRYILPLLPLLFICASKSALLLVRHVDRRPGTGQVEIVSSAEVLKVARLGTPTLAAKAAAVALVWSIASSLCNYPHSLSYFNESVGGSEHGDQHLLESSIAWGQDLWYLKEWCDAHPEARPLHAAAFGVVDPHFAGIEFTSPPLGPGSRVSGVATEGSRLGPLPGWYVIDVNFLHGSRFPSAIGQRTFSKFCDDEFDLTYFRRFHPVSRIGYSLRVYHLTAEECNPIRRELGLTPVGPGE